MPAAPALPHNPSVLVSDTHTAQHPSSLLQAAEQGEAACTQEGGERFLSGLSPVYVIALLIVTQYLPCYTTHCLPSTTEEKKKSSLINGGQREEKGESPQMHSIPLRLDRM